MKLKVISTDDTPKNAMRRVILEHDGDESHGWIRDDQDLTFMLWSNCDKFTSDKILVNGRRIEVDSPFEEILDEEGFGTGNYKLREGIIAFGVDVYDHSGLAYALHGEGGACFSCPWDTSRNLLWLWTDKERWDKLCGNCEWKFVEGKPTDELYQAAHRIAKGEIEEMNLCEQGSYYGYKTEKREIHHEKTEFTFQDGRPPETHERDVDEWVDCVDSCWGFLTENPAQDCDFPLGIPVTSEESYIVGDTFEQECFAYRDKKTGKFLDWEFEQNGWPSKYKVKPVDNAKNATLMCRQFLTDNLKSFEKDFKRKLEIIDVTEEVWANYPECIVVEKEPVKYILTDASGRFFEGNHGECGKRHWTEDRSKALELGEGDADIVFNSLRKEVDGLCMTRV